MKYCHQCSISTADMRKTCPLCHAHLKDKAENDPNSKAAAIQNYETFPKIKISYEKNNLVIKILMLISVVISIICITINIMIPTRPFWGIYVVIGIGSMWINLINSLKKHTNIIKSTNSHVVIISLLAIVWDFITGRHGWSIEYVFPIVCLNAMISTSVVSKIFRYKVTDYLIYLIINIILGFVPLLFIIFGFLDTIYPSISCIIGSVIAFLTLLTFEEKNIREELKRRLHF